MGVGRQKGLTREGGEEKSSFVRVLSKHLDSKKDHVTFLCLRISPDVRSQSACSIAQPKQKALIHHHPCQPSTPAAQPNPTSHYEIPPPYHLPHPCSAPCQVLQYFIHLHCAPSLPANSTSQHQPYANTPPKSALHHHTTTTTLDCAHDRSDLRYQSKLAI